MSEAFLISAHRRVIAVSKEKKMKATQTQNQSNITREQILKIFGVAFGSSIEYPNPDEPHKPGPWDPIIREALERAKVFGPHPEPWRERFDAERILRIIARRFPQIWDVIGDGHSFDEVMLNPQPLPPRWTFAESFAQIIIRRAELIRDITANLRGADFEERGIIVVGGRDFLTAVDEFCGNNFRLVRPKPRPPWWKDSFDALDYLMMATQFERAARETGYEDLRRLYREAGKKLVDASLAGLH
jgi:hypothetical protein